MCSGLVNVGKLIITQVVLLPGYNEIDVNAEANY